MRNYKYFDTDGNWVFTLRLDGTNHDVTPPSDAVEAHVRGVRALAPFPGGSSEEPRTVRELRFRERDGDWVATALRFAILNEEGINLRWEEISP